MSLGGFRLGGFQLGATGWPSALVPGGFTGLLDEFSGAAAAYSLRKLSKNTTNVVRVRRSSDDTEQDFTANQVSDGSLTTFCGAGDGFVATWYDQSGNSRNATQTTTTAQPKIVDSGSLVTGGLDFDGSNHYLNMPSAIGISGTIARSFFGVVIRDGVGVTSSAMIGIGDGTTTTNADKWNITAEYAIRVFGGNELYNGGSLSTLELFNLTFPAGSTDVVHNVFRLNGAAIAAAGSGSATINTDNTYNYIGLSGATTSPAAGTCYDGKMNELIIYASDQTANQVGIEANIADAYGITI